MAHLKFLSLIRENCDTLLAVIAKPIFPATLNQVKGKCRIKLKYRFITVSCPSRAWGRARFKVQGSKFKVQEKGFGWINITG
jgi:hypothetical protein